MGWNPLGRTVDPVNGTVATRLNLTCRVTARRKDSLRYRRSLWTEVVFCDTRGATASRAP